MHDSGSRPRSIFCLLGLCGPLKKISLEKIIACGSEGVNVYWREPTDRDPRRLGKKGAIPKPAYASSHRHQNDSCIKMGSDESNFNVSLTIREKSEKTVCTDHNF